MAGFLIGCIVGVFGVICLALCQVQNKDNVLEKVYFAISTDIDGVKLYLNKRGSYGEFSIEDTLIATSVSSLNKGYEEITSYTMATEGISIEKMSISTRFVQSFN